MNGKSIMSWNVPAVANGDPEDFAKLLLTLNFEGVCLKAGDGNRIQTVSTYSPWPEWGQNIRSELMVALRAAGLKVYFWHFLYGYDPAGEADVAITQTARFQPDGYIWNVEGSFDKRPTAEQNARLISKMYKDAHPETVQGLCWWALPKSSSGIEWHPISVAEAFFETVLVGMPMMYWQGKGANAAVDYLYRSLKLWRDMTDLPIVPIGRVYNGDGGYADAPGIADFADGVYEMPLPENLVGNSWYSFDKAVQNHSWLEALQATPMFGNIVMPPKPDPDPIPVCPNDERIKTHTRVLVDLNTRLLNLEHPPEPEPEPDPPESPVWPYTASINLRSHDKDYTVAWAITDWYGRAPVIETNVWAETNDKRYKFFDLEQIDVRSTKVTSDGGKKWFELHGLPPDCPHGRLFVKKEHAMKNW